MRRLAQISVVILTALFLTGCASDSIPAGVDMPTSSSSPKTRITAAPTPTPVPAGERTNPYAFGVPQNISLMNDKVESSECIITLADIIRGEEAWNLLHKANQFNDPPAAGKEYLLAHFTLDCISVQAISDAPVRLTIYDFQYSSESYSVSSCPAVVYPDEQPDLNLTLYAGASGDGWVCFEVDQTERTPYAVLCGSLWFSLNSNPNSVGKTPSSDDNGSAQSVARIADTMMEDFKEFGTTTSFKDNEYSILMVAPDGSAAAAELTPETIRPSWSKLVTSLLNMNKSILDLFVQSGYPEVHVDLMVESDSNSDNMLLYIYDDAIMYDVLNPDTDNDTTSYDVQPIIDWLQTAETKGRHDGKKYVKSSIDDEELRFIATYFYYCMHDMKAAAVAMHDPKDEADADTSLANLDMTTCKPRTITINDKNVIVIIQDTASGELSSFGTFYNPFTGENQMLTSN